MTTIQYGLTINGILYGWMNKQLYRLPCVKGNRSYSLKKMSQQMIGNNIGYGIAKKKYTINQLQQITTVINYRLNDIKDDHLPF